MSEVDWEAEGLLDGLDDAESRQARSALLDKLREDGAELEELRAAVAEERLALLPVERVLRSGEELLTPKQAADASGLDVDSFLRLRRALGLPSAAEDEPSVGASAEALGHVRALTEVGIDEATRLEIARVVGRSMSQIAEAVRTGTARVIASPEATEQELGLRYAEIARAAAPAWAPILENVLAEHLRTQIGQDVIAAADPGSERIPGTAEVAVCFADLTGFTRLGEGTASTGLGKVAGRLEELATEAIRPPVRIVKLIGDEVMFVSRDPTRMVEVALDLIDAAESEGDDFPQLHLGAAWGEAVGRAGDWFGRPVNLASRITDRARPGSFLVTEELKERAEGDFEWSFAGRKRLKGVHSELPLHRVRRRGVDSPASHG